MEHAAFERLCEDHYRMVVRVAYLITGDRQEALDIAQETFARAYERWKQVSTMQQQAGWLYRVATNLAMSWRRAGRRSAPGRDEAVEDAAGTDPALLAALGTLTPAQRSAVVVRYYLDLSIETSAEVLHKRPGTVRALTSQGVARLRQELGEDWLEVRDV